MALAGKVVIFQSDGTFTVAWDRKHVEEYTELRFPHGHSVSVTDFGRKVIHEETFVDGSSIKKESYSNKPEHNTVTMSFSDGTKLEMKPERDEDEGVFRVVQTNPDHTVIEVKNFNPEGLSQVTGTVRSRDSEKVDVALHVIQSKRGLWRFGINGEALSSDATASEADAFKLYDLDQFFQRTHEQEIQRAFSARKQETALSPEASLPLPSSESFSENKPECEDWALAHKLYCGDEEYEAAKAVLHYTRFITTNEMKAKLDGLMTDFIQSMHGKRFAALTVMNKSSSWLMSFYKTKVLEAGGQIVEFVDRNRVESLRGVYDLGIRDYLILEDGLYSGAQMGGALASINLVLGHDAQNINMHLLSFATTEKANERIRGSAPPMHVDMVTVETIHPLLSLTSDSVASTLEKMYRKTPEFSVFFEHKIPDLWSSLVAYIEPGKVYCKDEQQPEDLAKIAFQCFPDVIEPYKNRSTYNHEKKCIAQKWKSPFCIDYFTEKVHALTRLADYRQHH
jgi:hypothetical protein